MLESVDEGTTYCQAQLTLAGIFAGQSERQINAINLLLAVKLKYRSGFDQMVFQGRFDALRQHGEGLCRHASLHSQMAEELVDVGFSQILGMLFAVKIDVASNPFYAGFFGPDAVVSHTNGNAYLVNSRGDF